jgi:lysozyme
MLDDPKAPVTPPAPAGLTTEHLNLAILNEANRQFPYQDTVGKWTIGIGHNLTDKGLSMRMRQLLFEEDWIEAQQALLRIDPWVVYLDPVRQAVFVDLVFNMGPGTWRQFKQSRAAFQAGDFEMGIVHLKNSKWYRQVGTRADRLIDMLITGLWPWDPRP